MKKFKSLKGHWGMTFIVMALVGYFSILGFSQTPEIDSDGDVIQTSAVSKTKMSAQQLIAVTPRCFELPTSFNPIFELASQKVSEPYLPITLLSPNFRGPPALFA